MKLGILLSAVVFAGALPIAANEYALKPGVLATPRMAKFDLDSLTVISADGAQDQRAETRLSKGELRLLRGRHAPARGDGGGAAVENLEIWQRNFVESDCPEAPQGMPINVIFFFWNMPSPNALGTDIIIDDVVIANVDDAAVNIGGNMAGLRVDEVTAGIHTFGIEDPDTGTSETIELEVLDTQPMADPTGLRLEAGPTSPEGSCIPSISYQNNCPVPDAYDVLVTDTGGAGAIAEGVASTFSGVIFPDFPAADYTAEVFGFMAYNDDPNALYRCCPVTLDPVTFACPTDACGTPPASVLVQQSGYAGDTAGNSLILSWMVDESFEGGTNILVNDALLGVVPTTGFSNGDLVGIGLVAPPGEVTIGVQGLCANDVPSAVSDVTFEVLGESPHPNPFVGDIFCSHDDATDQTVSQWTSGDCSSFFELYFVPNPDATPEGEFVRRVRGSDVETRVNDTTPGELTVDLQGFVWVGNDFHSAVRERCITERPGQFIRGVCNNGVHEVKPQLSNAVFILRALFQGGDQPTCNEACDMNDDTLLNVADGVYLLRYLFSGSAAPPGYVNKEPACNDIEEGMDCATPNESCPI